MVLPVLLGLAGLKGRFLFVAFFKIFVHSVI
jgi:hypothetical protein